MYNISKKILLVPLTAIFIAFLAAGVSAAMSFSLPANIAFSEDGSTTINLLGNTTGYNTSVTYTYSGASKIHVAIANGIATLTAEANWNGQEVITFNATDQTPETKTAAVTIKVNAVNDAPTITTASSLTAKSGTQFSYQLNVTDPDIVYGDSITYSADAKGWTTFSMSSAGLMQFAPQDADIGLHTVTITARDAAGANATKDITIFVTESCDDESVDIRSVDIEDATGDDTETVPGDYLDLDFDIVSTMTQDMSDVKAKAWLQNSDGVRIGSKVETEAEDLESKDSRSETLRLRVDPTAKSGTYTLFIRAEGTDENSNDKCGLYAKTISIKRNSHELLIDNVVISTTAPVCGGKAQVTATVYNIGSTAEDDVKLRVRNSELNIDLYTTAFELKTSGSSAKAEKTIIFDLPAAAKGTYSTEVSAVYNGGSDSVLTTTDIAVTCGATVPTVTTGGTAGTAAISIPVTTVSAESGQQIKFTATIKNTEATDKTYQLSLAGTTDWATASIEPSEVTLASGTDIPVYIYITPKSGFYGDQTATVTVKSGTTVLATKTLTVSMPQKQTTTITPKNAVAMPTLELSNEAMAAIAIAVIIIAGGFVYSRYRAHKGVEVYGKKRGRKSEE